MADIIQSSMPMLDLNAGKMPMATGGMDASMLDSMMPLLSTALGSNSSQGNSFLPNNVLPALIQLLQLLVQQIQEGQQNGTNRGNRHDGAHAANRGGRHERTNAANDNGSTNNAPVAGAYNQASATTPKVKSAANFAATELGGTLKSVNNASQQVVAGMNYNMDIQLTDGQTYNVTVYEALDGSYTLSDAATVFT